MKDQQIIIKRNYNEHELRQELHDVLRSHGLTKAEAVGQLEVLKLELLLDEED